MLEKEKKMKLFDKIYKYEDGLLDEKETVQFFQWLIDSGNAWKLQGHYGRIALELIESGDCREPDDL